ncbi:hypothetical protein [Actinocatenispora rupis]|uniref:Uncharacterized protein n=1 Tax=Actinocatenispora rupis TaxID=519421 RepID=A0A8J3N874_9ACTN|nr:hypothetical protein [Actinocatenispora rupis]GID10009.1 hypothetical protein Aru02nite_08980 [Actinocatenispora rupis]
MGIRGWWQRVWRRLRSTGDGTTTVREAQRSNREQLTKYDTRHRGGSRL